MARIDYDAVATDFEHARGLPLDAIEAWRDAVAARLPRIERPRILDLGAGTGIFARAFAGWFDARVLAVEPSAGMRAEAGRLQADPRVAVIGGEAERIPLREGSCDAAWLSTVIHHVGDLAACARELRRVVRGEGVVLVRSSFPGRHEHITLFRRVPAASRVASTFPSIEATADAFAGAGFTLRSVEGVRQVSAPSMRAFAERVRLRADTTLRLISDQEYSDALASAEADAATESDPQPIIDRIDLLTFTR